MSALIRSLIVVVCLFSLMSSIQVQAAEESEEDVKTLDVVGQIVSINDEASSFDLEYVPDEMTGDKQTKTFFVTEISNIDIAMNQGTLADLEPGLRVLVEFAPMPDGTNVVESVWVKK